MKKFLLGLTVLAAAGFGPRTGFADTVTSFTVPNNINAQISYAPAGLSNLYVESGQIALTMSNGATLLSFCTDVYDDLATGTFTATPLATNRNTIGDALTQTQIGEIGGLIVHAATLLSAGVSTPGATLAQISSATQLAIWSVEYGSGFSFTSDDASLNGSIGLVATYVADAQNDTFTPDVNVTELVVTGNQGQSYVADPSPVPEPMSVALLGTGLVALSGVVFARNRKGSAVAAGR